MTFRKPAAGTLLGATALVVALAGTGPGAEAAKLINGKLIKANTVTSTQIKDGTIQAKDLAASAKSAGKVGPQGPAGAPGTPGTPGVPGAPGTTGYEVVGQTVSSVATGTQNTALVYCPNGKKALGGGGTWSGGPNNAAGWLASNYPLRAIRNEVGEVTGNGFPETTLADGWAASGTNNAGGPRDLKVWVICATVG